MKAQAGEKNTTKKPIETSGAHSTFAPTRRTVVSTKEIETRAYEIWLKKGCVHGFDLEDWLEAERELLDESL